MTLAAHYGMQPTTVVSPCVDALAETFHDAVITFMTTSTHRLRNLITLSGSLRCTEEMLDGVPEGCRTTRFQRELTN